MGTAEQLTKVNIKNAISVTHELFGVWNTSFNLVLWIITIYLVANYSVLWALFYPGILVLNEICIFFFNINLTDASEAIHQGYGYSRWIDEDGSASGDGLDYGFNFYNGDYDKSRGQAQKDKFEFAYEKLGLKKGMRLLDCGCGCGDWMNWLKTEKGIEVHGINISISQVKVCRERGLTVEHTDWKAISSSPQLQERLYGKFDAVSFWDTVEHYVPMHLNRQYDKQDAIYRHMFDMAKKCLKPTSDVARIWISCIHVRMNLASMKNWTWRETAHRLYYYWLLDKFHSGCYPGNSRDQLVTNAKAEGIELIDRKDTTLDYYMTSVLNPTHFGKHKFRLTTGKAMVIFIDMIVDPNWFARILWCAHEGWMNQFDESNIEQSDMLNWWLWLQVPKAMDR